MLEFIILGEIPGTTIQLGFTQYLQLSLVLGLGFLAFYEVKFKKETKEQD
jgi:hypothetical protein